MCTTSGPQHDLSRMAATCGSMQPILSSRPRWESRAATPRGFTSVQVALVIRMDLELARRCERRRLWESPFHGHERNVATMTTTHDVRLDGDSPLSWRLREPTIRAAIYESVLIRGTESDSYRWVNLADLAALWDLLRLPDSVRADWESVLCAFGLLVRPCKPKQCG